MEEKEKKKIEEKKVEEEEKEEELIEKGEIKLKISITKEKFSKMVKKLRMELNYRQEDLVNKSGLTFQTISKIENHPQNVTLGTIRLLADGFGMTMLLISKNFKT